MSASLLIPDDAHRNDKSGGRKTGAIAAAIIVHVVLGAIFTLVAVLPALRDEPEIVAAIIAPPDAPVPEMQKKVISKQVQQTSASAAASMTKLLRANSAAVFAAPEVTKSTSALGLGEGDFGSGFGGSGAGAGMGSGATFFGKKSAGNRVVFVIDYSGSLSKAQVDLTYNEMAKSLKSLVSGVQYQVILFAGGGYFAWPDWEVKTEGKWVNIMTSPEGDRYKFFSPKKNYGDYEFDGPDSQMPKAPWLSASPTNINKTLGVMRKKELFGGTDWLLALKIAHNLKPAPDVIYFMSDGTGGNTPGPILSYNRSHGKPVINTFAMQTKSGTKEFAAIAKGTSGEFTMVLKGGKTVSGEDYLKDPGKYARDLK
jgi:hypothetical protein